jgi:hypothetical protein
MISQHRPNPQINHKCTLCKQLKTTAVAKKMKTVYSNSPSHGLSVYYTTTQTDSVCRRQSLAARQLQWSVTLLYYHTLCHGLAVSLTLLCRLLPVNLAPHNNEKRQRASGAVDVQEGGRHL